jgi:hypothetical protein
LLQLYYVVLLALSRLIISFILKSSGDSWLFLTGYFILFIPPVYLLLLSSYYHQNVFISFFFQVNNSITTKISNLNLYSITVFRFASISFFRLKTISMLSLNISILTFIDKLKIFFCRQIYSFFSLFWNCRGLEKGSLFFSPWRTCTSISRESNTICKIIIFNNN